MMTSATSVGEPSEDGRVAVESQALNDRDYQIQATFRHSLRSFLRFSEEQARKHGITPQQHITLLSIRGDPAYPRVTVGDVAEAMQMRHHSASLLVDRCVKRGLIDRREDPDDRRKVMLSLTDAGEKVLETITQANRTEWRSLDIDSFRNSLQQAFDKQSHSTAVESE